MFTSRTSTTNSVAGPRIVIAVALTLAMAALSAVTAAAPASAAPSKNGEFTLTCDNGKSYTAVTPPGNGNFTPAMATDGTRFIPVAFGESTFEFTEDGVVIDSGTEPGSVKGNAARSQLATSECTFSSTFSYTENGKVYVGTFSGSVTAVLVGRTQG
jgi:hypothetical protein